MSARDGKDKAASPFRQESLDRAKSPEQLDDYIRVSNPGVWMVLGAVLLLWLAGVIWACCGRLPFRMERHLFGHCADDCGADAKHRNPKGRDAFCHWPLHQLAAL